MNSPSDMQQFVDSLPEPLRESYIAHAQMQVEFYENALATGQYDRALLRECLAAYGRFRNDLLTHLGLDLASEELMPLPAHLHDA